MFLSLSFSFFPPPPHLPKIYLYNSKCLPVWVCSPQLQNRSSPQPRARDRCPFGSPNLFFPLIAPELVPWSQTRKYFILQHITYHSTALDPQARRTARFWVGDRTPTVSWFPLPVQQSSSRPCLERERNFHGMLQASSNPCPHWRVLQMLNLY